jgi:DNA (cytosine-5)-methyltransferase 1
VIGDLPLLPSEHDWHVGRNPRPESLLRYRLVPPGGNRFDLVKTEEGRALAPRCWIEKLTGSTDVFGRLEWDKPALTIRTEFFKPEKGRYLHPQADRPITHREAMRLQTFPDDFQWVGSRISVARQVGNAVPPELARHIALELRSMLSER